MANGVNQQKGQAVSDIGCYQTNRDVELWCSAVGWPRAKSFAVRMYGHQSAQALAQAYAHKGDWFYGCWQEPGCPNGFQWTKVYAAYVLSREFNDWFDGVPIDTPAFHAGMTLVNVVPNPVPV